MNEDLPSRPSSAATSGLASRPTSAAIGVAPAAEAMSWQYGPLRPGSARVKADKLARIGLMLRKQGGYGGEGLRKMQNALHLDPEAASIWKTLGHALAQEKQLEAACSAFRAAAVLAEPEGEDIAARTGLATVLTQLGQPGAATDELLKIRRAGASSSKNAGASALMAEPLERLCRRLMPGHRFVAVQAPARAKAWKEAILAKCPRGRMIDISNSPLPAMLASTFASAAPPLLRIESLPLSVANEMLRVNSLQARSGESPPPIQLIAATNSGLPPPSQEPYTVEGELPDVVLADCDATDVLSSNFIPSIVAVRALTTAKPTVLPFALEVHVALVESEELARLNSVSEPVCGLDLSALNGLSHRTRAVRLAELKHVMLTKPVTALKLRLDARELPSLESESEIELPVERSGKAHAIVLWHTMKLNAMYKLTTAPGWPNDSDVTVRQVVHYLWRAQPGDVDWAAEKKETAAAAEFAQAAAAAVVAVAQAAAALGTAVTQLEEAANEAADLSAQEAEDAEEAAKLARGRAEHGGVAKPDDDSLISRADWLSDHSTKAAEACETVAVQASAAVNAVTAVAAAVDKVSALAADAMATAASIGHDVYAKTSGAEVQAWAAAQEVAESMSAATETLSDAIDAAFTAEPKSVQMELLEEEENRRIGGGDTDWRNAGKTVVTSQRVLKEFGEEEGSSEPSSYSGTPRPLRVSMTGIETEEEFEVRRVIEAQNARTDAREAVKVGAANADAATKALMEAAVDAAGARQHRMPVRTGADAGGTIGAVPVSAGSTLKLRFRRKPRHAEFQLCGPPVSSESVEPLVIETGETTFLDKEGRIVTMEGTAFLTTHKLRVRSGAEMWTDEVGEVKRGTKVFVLEKREVEDPAHADPELPSYDPDATLMRAQIVVAGMKAPIGWVSCLAVADAPPPPEDGSEPVPPSEPVMEDSLVEADSPTAKAVLAKMAKRVRRPSDEKGSPEKPPPDSPEKEAAPLPIQLLARSGPDPAVVQSQNFGNPRAELPLSVYHFPMVNDRPRNDAFAAAIMRAVTSKRPDLVLDIGSGTGLLAMLAAKAGAPRVLAVEMTPELASIAKGLVASHGLEESVRVMPCHSSKVHLDPTLDPTYDPSKPNKDKWQRRADLLVFEILGTDPLCEGLLPALRDARTRLLQPTATVIPCELEVHAVFVESEELARLNSVSEPVAGLDLSALNRLSHRTRAVRLSELRHEMLTNPVMALRLKLDKLEAPAAEGEAEIELPVKHSGKAHAIVAWFTAYLDERRTILVSTAPGVAEPMRGYSWGQSAHFLPAGTRLKANETVRLKTRWTDKGISFALSQREVYAPVIHDQAAMTEGLTQNLRNMKAKAEDEKQREAAYREKYGLDQISPTKQVKVVVPSPDKSPQMVKVNYINGRPIAQRAPPPERVAVPGTPPARSPRPPSRSPPRSSRSPR